MSPFPYELFGWTEDQIRENFLRKCQGFGFPVQPMKPRKPSDIAAEERHFKGVLERVRSQREASQPFLVDGEW